MEAQEAVSPVVFIFKKICYLLLLQWSVKIVIKIKVFVLIADIVRIH